MYWTALLIGFLGNFHCIGMCGPIALSLPIGKFSPIQKILRILLYNFGRIIAYGLIGGIVGVFGLGLRYIGIVQSLSIISGIFLLFVGILSFPNIKLKSIRTPKKIMEWVKKKLSYYLQQKKWSTLFFIGFFNGFLPCGLVFAALIGSLVTDTWIGGISYMMLFGLGTLPLMLFLPYISQMITSKVRIRMRKIVPYSLLFFGLLFILRGSNLGIPYLSPKIEKAVDSVHGGEVDPVLYCH